MLTRLILGMMSRRIWMTVLDMRDSFDGFVPYGGIAYAQSVYNCGTLDNLPMRSNTYPEGPLVPLDVFGV